MANIESSNRVKSSIEGRGANIELILQQGVAIPAHPLALNAERKLDERRQRALSRYYLAAGAGGLAVGVHTTQFRIHKPESGLLQPVLELAAEEMDRAESVAGQPLIRVAGICGETRQALKEAHLAHSLGYEYGLVNLGDKKNKCAGELLDHCRRIAETIQLFGFYLQPAVGGTELSYEFWKGFCEIQNAVAIKIAAFDRYRTLEIIRAVAESGREDIALYTGNDDNIVLDLVTPYSFNFGEKSVSRRFVGGLLGHWAVWTAQAVQLYNSCKEQVKSQGHVDKELLCLAIQVTDCNAAIFDAANHFSGCIPGIHEVLRRQGLLAGIWCLDEQELLSLGQAKEIDRVSTAYPHLTDNAFVAENLDRWLSG